MATVGDCAVGSRVRVSAGEGTVRWTGTNPDFAVGKWVGVQLYVQDDPAICFPLTIDHFTLYAVTSRTEKMMDLFKESSIFRVNRSMGFLFDLVK
jgi:hypothetical protein